MHKSLHYNHKIVLQFVLSLERCVSNKLFTQLTQKEDLIEVNDRSSEKTVCVRERTGLIGGAGLIIKLLQ